MIALRELQLMSWVSAYNVVSKIKIVRSLVALVQVLGISQSISQKTYLTA